MFPEAIYKINYLILAGFCCKCGKPSWFSNNGIKSLTYRGGEPMHCDYKFEYWNRRQSASCLRWGSDWWVGYTVNEPRLRFKIVTSFSYEKRFDDPSNKPAPGGGSELLTVSPTQMEATNKDRNCIVHLAGDFLNYRSFPQLNDVYLFTPNADDPHDNPFQKRVKWLLIPKGHVTDDGLECNKIGVGFTPFRIQERGCYEPVGTCLASQLWTFAQAEAAACALVPPRPIFSVLKEGVVDLRIHNFEGDPDSRVLTITLDQIMTSVVTLEVEASGMEFFVNRSPGKIISASVPTFEAYTRYGQMEVVVQNTGTIVSLYFIQVHACSSGIIDPEEKQETIAPGASATVKFDLETIDDKANIHTCKVDLLDSFAVNVFSQICQFQTTQTENSKGDQSGVVLDKKPLVNYTSSWSFKNPKSWFSGWSFMGKIFHGSIFGSCQQCNFFNILCAMKRLCWSRMVESLGFILLIVAGFIAFGYLNKSGLITSLLKKILALTKGCSALGKSSFFSKTSRSLQQGSSKFMVFLKKIIKMPMEKLRKIANPKKLMGKMKMGKLKSTIFGNYQKSIGKLKETFKNGAHKFKGGKNRFMKKNNTNTSISHTVKGGKRFSKKVKEPPKLGNEKRKGKEEEDEVEEESSEVEDENDSDNDEEPEDDEEEPDNEDDNINEKVRSHQINKNKSKQTKARNKKLSKSKKHKQADKEEEEEDDDQDESEDENEDASEHETVAKSVNKAKRQSNDPVGTSNNITLAPFARTGMPPLPHESPYTFNPYLAPQVEPPHGYITNNNNPYLNNPMPPNVSYMQDQMQYYDPYLQNQTLSYDPYQQDPMLPLYDPQMPDPNQTNYYNGTQLQYQQPVTQEYEGIISQSQPHENYDDYETQNATDLSPIIGYNNETY
ncbi:uncharacterized protein [Physcomitrium patens]|uniref:uncharacterized protein isoform X2 n=1 Tax=Physcomitrium patens TaxID=3218 RepID=UPI003CCD1F9A